MGAIKIKDLVDKCIKNKIPQLAFQILVIYLVYGVFIRMQSNGINQLSVVIFS